MSLLAVYLYRTESLLVIIGISSSEVRITLPFSCQCVITMPFFSRTPQDLKISEAMEIPLME